MQINLTTTPRPSAAPPQALWTLPRGVELRPDADLAAARARKPDAAEPPAAAAAHDALLRRKLGELSGTVFYSTLIREMQKSTFETELLHGGRGEEAFRGQLALELGKAAGAAPNDPVTARLFRAVRARHSALAPRPDAAPSLEVRA